MMTTEETAWDSLSICREETYHIESSKMMRYARRRGKEDEMKKILEEIEDAEA